MDAIFNSRFRRRGMTLVELLVVIMIIMAVSAATIARLRPGIDHARIREAARSVQVYFSSARNQAIATGRKCGVIIDRLSAEPGCSMSLSQVESPLPYCGEAIPSLATVTGGATVSISYAPAINTGLIHAGDLIQFGMQGPWYTLAAGGGSATLDMSQGLSSPWSAGGGPVPFKILRQPVKGIASALQLPSPAAIDLTQSGADPGAGFAAAGTLMVVFAPDGSLDSVSVNGTATHPTGPVCLMIGNRENVNGATTNLASYNSLWVAINPRTGLIVTTDSASTGDLESSRAYALKSDAMGGK